MLPTLARTVKPSTLSLLKEQAIIWLPLGGLALVLWLTRWDISLAHLFYQTDFDHHHHQISTFLRRKGTLPGTLFAALALFTLFWPHIWRKRPLFYRTALVVTLTAVFGVGLVNQIAVKKLADRPRPHEVVLADEPFIPSDTFRGNSMPSGHAAMGFILATPFFVLRRPRPRLAHAFLAAGLGAGFVLGLSRMALGAHFATDVLIAGAITLSAASLFTVASTRITRIPLRYLALGMLVFALCMVLGNRFTGIHLGLNLPAPFKTIDLPCQVTTVPADVTTPTLSVALNGYGAPISTLQLHNINGVISLKRSLGLYHNLTCTAQLSIPHT
ncbi:MAG: phosphatase PAP2 family protein, partial [Hyphomicrobiales bacterium]